MPRKKVIRCKLCRYNILWLDLDDTLDEPLFKHYKKFHTEIFIPTTALTPDTELKEYGFDSQPNELIF